VYAEDPANNFLPSVGDLVVYQKPSGENIRVDDGYEEGMEIPIYYDPMIAKLITYGATRDAAIANMEKAIANYRIEGIETTLPFGAFVMKHEAFTSGDFDTHFVKQFFTPEAMATDAKNGEAVAAMAGLKLYLEERKKLRVPGGL